MAQPAQEPKPDTDVNPVLHTAPNLRFPVPDFFFSKDLTLWFFQLEMMTIMNHDTDTPPQAPEHVNAASAQPALENKLDTDPNPVARAPNLRFPVPKFFSEDLELWSCSSPALTQALTPRLRLLIPMLADTGNISNSFFSTYITCFFNITSYSTITRPHW